jgi:hypothetical protein
LSSPLLSFHSSNSTQRCSNSTRHAYLHWITTLFQLTP